MADPNNLLIHEHQLALMLICKAANTSIKWSVADAMGLEATHRTDLYFPTPNVEDVARLKDEGYLALSVIRHPAMRLLSCWRDKVSNPNRFHQPFRRRYGGVIKPGMSFEAFVDVVSDIPDGVADQHFRSMSWDLVHDGKVVPEVIKIEKPDWWMRLRDRIKTHCGLDIGPERKENQTKVNGMSDNPKIRERYRQDFQRFGYA